MPWEFPRGLTCPELRLVSCLGRLRRLRRNHLDAAAGLLDRGDRGLGGAGDLDRELRLDLALGQQADAVALAPDHAGSHQRRAIHRGARLELARLDRLLQAADIDLDKVQPVDIVEAALGHAHVERHLAALEAVDGHARARRLALAAAPGGLALARADTAPDAHAV